MARLLWCLFGGYLFTTNVLAQVEALECSEEIYREGFIVETRRIFQPDSKHPNSYQTQDEDYQLFFIPYEFNKQLNVEELRRDLEGVYSYSDSKAIPRIYSGEEVKDDCGIYGDVIHNSYTHLFKDSDFYLLKIDGEPYSLRLKGITGTFYELSFKNNWLSKRLYFTFKDGSFPNESNQPLLVASILQSVNEVYQTNDLITSLELQKIELERGMVKIIEN